MGNAVFCDLGSGLRDVPRLSGWTLMEVDAVRLQDQLQAVRPEALILRTVGDDLAALKLLRQIRQLQPALPRVLLSQDATARYVSLAGEVADFALLANTDAERIAYALSRAQQFRQRLSDPALTSRVSDLIGHPPLAPPLEGLNNLIEQQVPESTASVAPLFRGFPELLKAVMALLNQPIFGCDRHLFSIDEALRAVGLRTLRDVTLLVDLGGRVQQPMHWSEFAFEHLVGRALACAHLAERIARNALNDRIAQGAAYQAGLMHDFGMLMLVVQDPERYQSVMRRAAELNQPAYALEKMEYGVTHADLSACLLDRVGASPRSVRAVLYHHVPKAARDGAVSPLTAVHVADSLLPQIPNGLGCNLGGRLSLDYLNAIGVADKRAGWEALARDQGVQLSSYW